MSLFSDKIQGAAAHFEKLIGDARIPRMKWARQLFPRDTVESVTAALDTGFSAPGCLDKVQPGMRIAICVGSRGIANIVSVVQHTVSAIRSRGGEPFIIPTMGSHGGATAEGQIDMLATLGVTEASVGAPIVSSLETRVVGTVLGDVDVHVAKDALEADGVVPIARIKPHTAFRGEYESGFMKIFVIGLGKHNGALESHKYGFGVFRELIPLAGAMILDKTPVLFGVALIENAFHETCSVDVVPAERLVEEEPKLLKKAFDYMGRIYFDNLDVLVVREIGKNISGDGMDPNITGTYPTPYAGNGLQAASRVVLGLTEETHGSSIGLGMADYSTLRVFEQVDPVPTYTNALTSRVSSVAKIPVLLPHDELAIRTAIYASTTRTATNPRIVLIKDTSDIEYIEISESLWEEAVAGGNVQLHEAEHEMAFDSDGFLIPAKQPM